MTPTWHYCGLSQTCEIKSYLKYQQFIKVRRHSFLLHLCSFWLLFAVGVTHGHYGKWITVPILYRQIAALNQPALMKQTTAPWNSFPRAVHICSSFMKFLIVTGPEVPSLPVSWTKFLFYFSTTIPMLTFQLQPISSSPLCSGHSTSIMYFSSFPQHFTFCLFPQNLTDRPTTDENITLKLVLKS
jgi:hypothetical protein